MRMNKSQIIFLGLAVGLLLGIGLAMFGMYKFSSLSNRWTYIGFILSSLCLIPITIQDYLEGNISIGRFGGIKISLEKHGRVALTAAFLFYIGIAVSLLYTGISGIFKWKTWP